MKNNLLEEYLKSMREFGEGYLKYTNHISNNRNVENLKQGCYEIEECIDRINNILHKKHLY